MVPVALEPTVCAGASATGGAAALIRLSGPRAFAIAARAGVEVTCWRLASGGVCPVRTMYRRGPRTATGHDLIEIVIPGAADLVDLLVSTLCAVGATPAAPGAFMRQAVATGRLGLDRAEAVLALTQATDAVGAAVALARLRCTLAEDLAPLRTRLLHLRALVESGLDFLDEHDVRPWDAAAFITELESITAELAKWLITAATTGHIPLICLVGAPNAGKSALFAALSGEPALISPIAGTTRDHLEATVTLDGRNVRLIDTAGWLTTAEQAHAVADRLDQAAIDRGREIAAHADVIVACAAPDAPLPNTLEDAHGLPRERLVIIATKADLNAGSDPRAVLSVSTLDGRGLDTLRGFLAQRLAPHATGSARQHDLLRTAIHRLHAALTLLNHPDERDDLLADDLRRAADGLAELVGTTSDDDVLNAIFQRFCIGK